MNRPRFLLYEPSQGLATQPKTFFCVIVCRMTEVQRNHFCHQCQTHVAVDADVQCVRCGGGFVEEREYAQALDVDDGDDEELEDEDAYDGDAEEEDARDQM